MSKLELAHLAPYLPYKLTGYCFWKSDSGLEYERTGELVEIKAVYNPDEVNPLVVKSKSFPESSLYSILAYGYETFKPRLRILSDITEESLNAMSIDQSDEFQIWELKERRITYSMMGYGAVQHLLANHFDVFGLIDQGLAVRYREARR